MYVSPLVSDFYILYFLLNRRQWICKWKFLFYFRCRPGNCITSKSSQRLNTDSRLVFSLCKAHSTAESYNILPGWKFSCTLSESHKFLEHFLLWKSLQCMFFFFALLFQECGTITLFKCICIVYFFALFRFISKL